MMQPIESIQPPTVTFHDDYWSGEFYAMASPCQVLMDLEDKALAEKLVTLAQEETLRIQNKFSRYRDDNIIYQINNSNGTPVKVDAETASLLDYAHQCYELSEGSFDITSGVLREVWTFDGSDHLPSKQDIAKRLKLIGWLKVKWENPVITLPAAMEIDLGGIGKEYAVDRSAMLIQQMLLQQECAHSVLVNYGGDLCTTSARRNGQGWIVGVEDPGNIDKGHAQDKLVHSHEEFELIRGGIATSGDTRRYLLKDGIRYSHILDPRTGWPIRDAPHSITVVANTCTEAGILATMAMLHGKDAESFLEEQAVKYWCLR